jgi:hypothetical protein
MNARRGSTTSPISFEEHLIDDHGSKALFLIWEGEGWVRVER